MQQEDDSSRRQKLIDTSWWLIYRMINPPCHGESFLLN